jgi:Ca2+-binding RTX toxin-like protein
VAAPGEVNRLTITAAGDHVVVQDAGAPLSAPVIPGPLGPRPNPCTVVDVHSVSCPTPYVSRIALGDRSDTATIGPGVARVEIDGQAGDDVLTGGTDGDVLSGGAGADELHGRAGDDLVRGLGGDDTLFGDLAAELDDPGADRIDGGDGNDTIDLSHGVVEEDDLNGDLFPAFDRLPDRLRCGAGADTVAYADPKDVLPPASDRASLVTLPLTAAGRRVAASGRAITAQLRGLAPGGGDADAVLTIAYRRL